MFIRCASKSSRLSFSRGSRTFLGLAGIAALTICGAPKAAAATIYHATQGYCQIDPGSQGADVRWNFIANPHTNDGYFPYYSTLVGTSNYNYEFATGECYWSSFAPAGTHASSTAKIVVEYQTVYNSNDNGTNPAGAARIYGGTSSSPGQYGSFYYHPPSNPQTNLITSGTQNFSITPGADLSQVVVKDLVNSGNQFTSSMELDILSIYISN